MNVTPFRVDSAMARVCVALAGIVGLAGGAAWCMQALALDAGLAEALWGALLGLLGLLFGRAAYRWKVVTADAAGLRGLAPERIPWSDVEEVWETYLSRWQPWPQRMVVRTRHASCRVWTTRPAIARCRELAGGARESSQATTSG